ncbi:MAG: hypothetical protein NZ585_09065 [Chloracidobacterium sp.]|nr:hypothetical protein [Chloracidobacterium sp.]MDW8217454.1 hypothetical protein [Acidobacteriota bacterium]
MPPLVEIRHDRFMPKADALARWGCPLILSLTFAWLTWDTWRKWGDPFVDFGIELYVAWQLAEGKHLYRDIIWLGGPLSQYANALWFRLFGASYLTLAVVNLAMLAGLTGVVYRFFAQTVGRWTGLAVGLTLLIAFAFQLYETNGSWSYVAPYRHEAVHGLGLAILALALLRGYLIYGGARRAFMIGLCFGAVSLTKIEPTVALAGALATGYGVSLRRVAARRAEWRRDAARFAAGALVLPVGFGLYLGAQMPLDVTVTGLLGNWAAVIRVEAVGQAFYQRVMGLWRWQENLTRVAAMTGVLLGGAAIGIGLELKLREVARGRLVWRGALFGGLWLLSSEFMPWPIFLRPLPALTALIAVYLAWRAMRSQDLVAVVERWIPLAAWSVFALLLLGKIALAAHAGSYGFTLALPATALVAAAALDLLPEALATRSWGQGDLLRSSAAGVMIAFWLAALESSSYFYAAKTTPLGDGRNRMLCFAPPLSDKAVTVGPAVEDMARLLPADATLAVIPDGMVINYLLRRPNPTPYVVFDPLMLAAYGGEARVVEQLAAHPPDYIVFVQRDFPEYGLGRFGQDIRCGRLITTWVAEHYEAIRIYGGPPAGERFGLALLRHRKPTTTTSQLESVVPAALHKMEADSLLTLYEPVGGG